MLQIQGVSKSYGMQNVLRNFSLDIKSGEIISVVGSSGSGKTTLLRLISGLEMPDDGQITLKNEIVSSNNNFVRPEDRDCSLVFQDYALFPNMSMRQNIYFGKNSENNKEKIEIAKSDRESNLIKSWARRNFCKVTVDSIQFPYDFLVLPM